MDESQRAEMLRIIALQRRYLEALVRDPVFRDLTTSSTSR